MSVVYGLAAKLYYKVGGVGGGGSWVEMTNVKDVTLTVESDEADVTTRANNGWEAVEPTLKKGAIEWDMVWDTTDAGFTAVREAYFDKSLLGLQVLDGAGGQGLQADVKIGRFTRNEPLKEALTVSVTAKPAYSANPPEWINA